MWMPRGECCNWRHLGSLFWLGNCIFIGISKAFIAIMGAFLLLLLWSKSFWEKKEILGCPVVKGVAGKNRVLIAASAFQAPCVDCIRLCCKLRAETPMTTLPRHPSSSGFPRDLATWALCLKKKKWGKKCLNPGLGYVLSYNRKFREVRVRKMGVWIPSLLPNAMRMWAISWPSQHPMGIMIISLWENYREKWEIVRVNHLV